MTDRTLWKCKDGSFDINENGKTIHRNVKGSVILHAPELLEALELAQERIYELSKWARIPVEGETIVTIHSAIQNAKGPKGLCQHCGEKEGDLCANPFTREVHNEVVLMHLCEDCYSNSASDV